MCSLEGHKSNKGIDKTLTCDTIQAVSLLNRFLTHNAPVTN